MKNKRPSSNPQSAQSVRRALQDLRRDLANLKPGFKPPRLPEGFKLATLPESLKQEFKRVAEVARKRQEQALEQEIVRERQERTEREQLERAKQRPSGGRPEKLTEEMGQAACAELENWILGQNPWPTHDDARIYIGNWLKEAPRKVHVSESTINTRIVSPTYRHLRKRKF